MGRGGEDELFPDVKGQRETGQDLSLFCTVSGTPLCHAMQLSC